MTHPDSPEFLAILERVPRWHMLTHRKKCDSCDGTGGFTRDGENNEFDDNYEIIECAECGGVGTIQERMKIPEHVRRSEAWWALYNQLATRPAWARFELDLQDKTWPLSIYASTIITGIRGFSSGDEIESSIPILGGETEIIKNLQEGPGAYVRWVLNV